MKKQQQYSIKVFTLKFMYILFYKLWTPLSDFLFVCSFFYYCYFYACRSFHFFYISILLLKFKLRTQVETRALRENCFLPLYFFRRVDNNKFMIILNLSPLFSTINQSLDWKTFEIVRRMNSISSNPVSSITGVSINPTRKEAHSLVRSKSFPSPPLLSPPGSPKSKTPRSL